jgi:hypothetical protein
MADLRQAAQQALEAMQQRDNATLWHQAIHALQNALPCTYKCEAWPECGCAAQEEQEPAYSYAKQLSEAIWGRHYKDIAPHWKPLDDLIGVLTQIDNMTAGLAPPRREWQGLTEEEIQSIHDTYHKRMGPQEFARAVEQALKEKNA